MYGVDGAILDTTNVVNVVGVTAVGVQMQRVLRVNGVMGVYGVQRGLVGEDQSVFSKGGWMLIKASSHGECFEEPQT